jgi:hypothetical protein
MNGSYSRIPDGNNSRPSLHGYNDGSTTVEIREGIRTSTEYFLEQLKQVPGKSAQCLKPARTAPSMKVFNPAAQLIETCRSPTVAGICDR